MRNSCLILLLTTLFAANLFAQKNKSKEKLIDPRLDQELREYYTEQDLFMLGKFQITPDKKQEMLERAKEKRQFEASTKDLVPPKKLLKISVSLFDGMEWQQRIYEVNEKNLQEPLSAFEARANQSVPCKIHLISESEEDIQLQFLAEESAFKFPNEKWLLSSKDTASFDFNYLIPPAYISKEIATLQVGIENTHFQIQIPIATLGYDLVSEDFTAYNQLLEKPFEVKKQERLHLLKKNQESVFSLYPFDPSQKPASFVFNQAPFFAVEISRSFNQLDLSQIPKGVYLARIMDFMQRKQSFRVLSIQ